MLPYVSVIVPVYNEPAGLSDTLEALSNQDYPDGCWEIIVVDNNSTDHTLDIVQSLATRISNLKVINETRKQSSYLARNTGIREAQGEIFAFIDADMTVESDWVSRGVDAILKGDGDYIGCRIEIYLTHSPPTIWEIYNQRTDFPIHRYIQEHGFAGAGNLFVRQEVFEKVGLFDERLISGGDVEFGNRVRDAGYKLYYAHANIMKHPARSSLESTWKKSFRIGEGWADLCHYFPVRYGPLTLRSVIVGFRPSIRLASFNPDFRASDLSLRQRLMLVGVANFVRFAGASGRLIRYIQRKRITD